MNKEAILRKASEEIAALVAKLEIDLAPFKLAVYAVTVGWRESEKEGTETLCVEIETANFSEQIDTEAVDS